jgi:hypothetical protein
MAGEENLALAGAAAVAEPTEAPAEEVVETPAEETPAEGGTPEGEEAPSGEETPEEHGEEEHPEGEEDEADYTSGDGRKILDAKLRKGIAELRKTDKVAAKAVADAYFSRQAILKEFPEAKSAGDAIQQIRGMRATLESYGGEQGLTDMKSEVEDWRGEAKQFAEGNPELIAKLGEADPEALVTNAQNVLAWLKDYKKGELYDQALLPDLGDRLEGANFYGALDAIEAQIKAGKGQEAYDLLQNVKAWANGIKEKSTKFKTDRASRPKVDPEREAIARDRQALDQEKVQHFEENVNSNLAQFNNKAISKTVEPFFRDLKLPNDGRREFVNALQSRIWAAQKTDKVFQSQAKAQRAKASPLQFAEFISRDFGERLPREFARLRNSMYPNWKPKGPGTGGANGKPNGAAPAGDKKPAPVAGASLMLKDPLPGDQVDWTKTQQIQYIAGKNVWGKNGKRYGWAVRH